MPAVVGQRTLSPEPPSTLRGSGALVDGRISGPRGVADPAASDAQIPQIVKETERPSGADWTALGRDLQRVLGSNVGSNPGDQPRRTATAKSCRKPIFNLWRPVATPPEGSPTTLSR
jgi:hypothetical protein